MAWSLVSQLRGNQIRRRVPRTNRFVLHSQIPNGLVNIDTILSIGSLVLTLIVEYAAPRLSSVQPKNYGKPTWGNGMCKTTDSEGTMLLLRWVPGGHRPPLSYYVLTGRYLPTYASQNLPDFNVVIILTRATQYPPQSHFSKHVSSGRSKIPSELRTFKKLSIE